MKRTVHRPLGLIVAVATLLGAVGSAFAAPAPGATDTPALNSGASSFCADAEERAFLTLINDYRRSNGLQPLVMTQTLSAASDHHSQSMADNDYFGHDLVPEGVTWLQNMKNHGYGYNTWTGENIAAGNSSAAATFTQWKNSAAHNANMLKPEFKAIGIGRAYNSAARYGWYWTTDFGGYVDAQAQVCGGTTPAPTPTTTAPAGGTLLRIYSSSRTSNSRSGTYAYDKNTSSSWYTITSSVPKYAYVSFDLRSVKAIGSIQWVFNRTGFADSLKIQVSTDRTNWTTLATVGNAPSRAWQTLKVATSARYVRFSFDNPNGDAKLGYLAEVKITT